MIKYLERGFQTENLATTKVDGPVTTRRLKLLLTTGHNQTPSHSREKFRSFVDFSIARKTPPSLLHPLLQSLQIESCAGGAHCTSGFRGYSRNIGSVVVPISRYQLPATMSCGNYRGSKVDLGAFSPSRSLPSSEELSTSCKRHRSSCQSCQTLMIIGE